ncbi:MAG TPA: hypothetical protein VGQ99_14555 [Tepidisphaeraceae bacterium]|jgi:hypothetical protein|nr:hypothetical protein [Tepidisphaeraceae bacterium]
MPLWTQHLLVILLITACAALLLRQAYRFYRGRSTGNCCSKGCAPTEQRPAQPKTAFLPREFLSRRR